MNQIESHDSNESNNDEAEEIADAWLDTAIECKQAGRLADCIEAHMQRMRVVPYYKTTDAIRLLGMGGDGCIDEISSQGVFATDERDDRKFIPSQLARNLGKDVRQLFIKRGYHLNDCQSFLLPFIKDGDVVSNKIRIFSAQSFVQHRHEVFDAKQEKNDERLLGELEILVWLFLFGLAVSFREAVEVLGPADMDTLLQAKLLRKSPVDTATMLVAEVQIYPVDMSVFIEVNDCNKAYGLFLTDWSLESLRPTHSAVMPVGYDTLELLAVTAGEMARQRKVRSKTDEESRKRILDVCCGCGIQGIFAWLCYKAYIAAHAENETGCDLVLTDINLRALHFATANLAINGIAEDCAFGLCGDLFESLAPEPFDLILCNPPFVAIPSTTDAALHEKTPLYGVGGGLDGMVCLRRILQSLYKFLSEQNTEAIALVVTEVPNVEESPTMLSSSLPESDQKTARIRIAYIEEDVETVEEYAREREVEAGTNVDHKEFLSSAITSGIYNRALVLISFARSEKEQDLGLFNFEGLQDDEQIFLSENVESDSDHIDPVDEQDMFLHPTGMDFARKALLFPNS